MPPFGPRSSCRNQLHRLLSFARPHFVKSGSKPAIGPDYSRTVGRRIICGCPAGRLAEVRTERNRQSDGALHPNVGSSRRRRLVIAPTTVRNQSDRYWMRC